MKAIKAAKENSQTPETGDVSVAISVNNKQVIPANQEDPCWKVCWEFIPKCPAPSVRPAHQSRQSMVADIFNC